MRFLRDPETLLTIACGVALGVSVATGSLWLSYLAVAFGSVFALETAIQSLRQRSVDVNLLMVLAAGGSVAVGRPGEAAVLLFLFSLSHTLEHYTMSRTKSAIEGLIKLRPETALRLDGEAETVVPIEALRIGDRVRVLPFEQLPADGKIISGSTSIDQQAMTGESAPVSRTVGDDVLAGTQNLESMIVVEVAREVGDATLQKIVDLVQDAQENKASGERISQWFGQRYTFFVIGAFAVALVVRLVLRQPLGEALYGSLTLLVALSPCALVISTPASTLSALAWCARNGILVRGGEFVELSGKVDLLAIDKTGTLTRGKPVLIEICVCSGVPETIPAAGTHCVAEEACWSQGEQISDEARTILRFAAAAEQYSTHPIALAIVDRAREFGIDVPEALDVTTHSGLGVSARIDGKNVRVGQRRFFESDSARLPPDFAVHAEELQRKGLTVAVLEVGGSLAALGLMDEPRNDAIEFLRSVDELGIRRVAMLTGDTVQTADAIGSQLGVHERYAGLMPDDKTELIDRFESEGARVMMIGDGVNDAPSLASASVGVAMGGLGSDIALNAADVVLMQDRLERVPQLIRLGRLANRIIRANLYFAAGVIVLLTFGTQIVDSIAPQWRNLLLPMAVVGHEGSTVLVILNGLRLLKGP